MLLEGTHTFSAPRQEVWEMLMDPDVIAKTIPGCESMKAIGEDEYEAQLSLGIAAFKGRYGSKVKLFDKKPPESFKLNIEGKGARGFLRGDVAIRLEEQGPDTILHYAAKNQIGGPIAAIGQRLVVPAAKMMINQGFKSLEKQLAERKR